MTTDSKASTEICRLFKFIQIVSTFQLKLRHLDLSEDVCSSNKQPPLPLLSPLLRQVPNQ